MKKYITLCLKILKAYINKSTTDSLGTAECRRFVCTLWTTMFYKLNHYYSEKYRGGRGVAKNYNVS